MAKYTGNILTNNGKDLLARAVAGGEMITFTKVELGKGVAAGEKEELTALTDSFKTLAITSTAKLEGGAYRVRTAFDNTGITADIELREIGVFARGEDGVEILYSYCDTDSPDLIPAEGSGVLERVEDIITYLSNAANINAVIDQSNIYVTIKDLVEGLAAKEDKFSKNGAFNKPFGTTTKTVMEGNKRASDLGGEPSFSKNSGFNKNKSDAVNSNDSETLATSKAVKTAYEKAIECKYDVGDYWITESTINPATKWAGTTWTKLEGRVLLGTSSGYALGIQGGRSTVGLTLANMAAHTHRFSGTTNTTGNHYHQSGNHRHRVDNHVHTQPEHKHRIRIGRNDDGYAGYVSTALGNYAGWKWDPCYVAGGENTGGSSPYTNYQNPNTSTTGNHNHTISGTTGSSGSGSAFNIMNPYRVVNIWRRTG